MTIRPLQPSDREELLEIWLRAVRASHTFLSEADIQSLHPHVREYLAMENLEMYVLCSDADVPMGFMGMTSSKMDSLFIDPRHQGQGGGRTLLRYARDLKGELTVDVNEQNPSACGFYQSCGFVIEGRSETDDAGRPFPLLHLRLAAPSS